MFALFSSRRQLVNSLPSGGTFALRHNPYLQSVKSGGSLARNARFGVVVVSSSCRRRVRRRQLVNSLPLGGTFALRHNPYLQSVKSGGKSRTKMLVLAFPSHKMWGHFRVLRDRRNFLAVCQCKRDVFSWQAQHFVMWPFAMSWQAQHFVTWRRCCFHESQMAVTCKRDTTANIVAGARFGDCLEKWRKLRKSHTFWAL